MARRRTTPTARQIFAGNMRQMRQAQGLSQDQLAHLAGVHRTYIGAVERCEKNVSIDSMEKIALALGCPVRAMLEEPE